MTSDSGEQRGEVVSKHFPLRLDNPQARALGVFFTLAAGIGLLVSLLLVALGLIDWEGFAFAIVFCVLFALAGIVNARLVANGSAILDSSGLTVRTRGWTHRYEWSDIIEVRLTSFSERGRMNRLWATMLRWPPEEPFAELILRRPLRVGLLFGRYGTRLIGVPLISGREIPLFPTDAGSFTETANSYLEAVKGQDRMESLGPMK